jgi:hypothetical protein
LEHKVSEEVSILGYRPKPKKKPTHFKRKFSNKRAQWNWMKKNMPEVCDVCVMVKEVFGDVEGVDIWSKRARRDVET